VRLNPSHFSLRKGYELTLEPEKRPKLSTLMMKSRLKLMGKRKKYKFNRQIFINIFIKVFTHLFYLLFPIPIILLLLNFFMSVVTILRVTSLKP
jgi:hypothetical protein